MQALIYGVLLMATIDMSLLSKTSQEDGQIRSCKALHQQRLNAQ